MNMAMTDYLKQKFEELDVTQEELSRFSEALKKEEFRKLLAEYAEEISNPENRAAYERELEQLENERGVDVTFIHPEPGFVLKSVQNGEKKCFINICKNAHINKPESDVTQKKESDGSLRKGITWSIPHSCAPPREDLDKSGNKCMVYDVVYHPDAYRMGETNTKFKQLLIDTACDTIEKNFHVKLDRKNMKTLTMPFKGTPTASVIRRPKENVDEKFDVNNLDDPLTKLKTPYSYPPVPPTFKADETPVKTSTKSTSEPVKLVEDQFTIPKYTLINRGSLDLQDCVDDKQLQHVNSTRPKELYIEIDLPLCKNASNVKLDIYEKQLCLESKNPNYKLDLSLPYPVNENDGGAKFDKTKKKLCITLPVIPFNMKIESKALIEENEEIKDETPVLVTEPVVEVIEKPVEILQSIPSVKFNAPSKCELKQNTKYFKLALFTNNIDEKSLNVNVNAQSVFVKYESTGSGGYITYYSVYLKFANDYFDTNTEFKCEYLNNKHVLLQFTKLNKYCIENAVLSLNESDSNTIDVTIESCEEDELKTKLANIEAGSEVLNSNVKFDLKLVSNEKFSLNLTNELDEDDDTNVVEKMEQVDEEYEEKEDAKTVELNNETSDTNEIEAIREMSSKVDLSEESDELSSSLNGTKLKGILKKPRSLSEGESHSSNDLSFDKSSSGSSSNSSSRNGFSSTTSSGDTLNDHKKSVTFNQEIKQTVFKSGSAVADLNKPHSHKNKKRNMRRKRTISDPSNSNNAANVRERSYSESSDDGGHHNHKHPNDNHNKKCVNNVNSNSEQEFSNNEEEGIEKIPEETKESESKDEVKNPFTMETMLQWKADGNNNDEKFAEKTKCAFKFTNSIIRELDD